MAGKQLATVDASEYEVLAPESETALAMQEVLEENFGNAGVEAFDLDRITIPAGGGVAWELPTLDGIESTQELVGVIVNWESPRAYWQLSLDESEGGATAPDCSSDDAVFGMGEFGPGSDGNPTGECAKCPMNQWGSDADGKGKGCKESRMLFVLLPERVLPVTVSLAPTSIQPLRKYLLRLAGTGTPYYGVATSLKLKKIDAGGGVKYSVVEPNVAAKLDPEMRAQAKEYGNRIRSAFTVKRNDDGEQVAAPAAAAPKSSGN